MDAATNKVELYREQLKPMRDWKPYLVAESGLPGPRGNLELAQAVLLEGDAKLFEDLLQYTADLAPVNSTEEFLFFCGVLGQGKLLSRQDQELWSRLQAFAGDPRWRTREAVAMALQVYGDHDMGGLLEVMVKWARGGRYQQRAAAAGLCEPRLLKQPASAEKVLNILDSITHSMVAAGDRHDDGFKVLRQAMGYCWSVAAAAFPAKGKEYMVKWFACRDRDIRWLMKENLSKNRLGKMDAAWVERWRVELE